MPIEHTAAYIWNTGAAKGLKLDSKIEYKCTNEIIVILRIFKRLRELQH